jgi:hypothetical protein
LWYRETHLLCKEIAGDEPFIIFPIMMYMDKTGTDVYNRSGLEPLLFTLCNFHRSCRNRHDAWKVLGFMPNLDANYATCYAVATSVHGTDIRTDQSRSGVPATHDVIVRDVTTIRTTDVLRPDHGTVDGRTTDRRP